MLTKLSGAASILCFISSMIFAAVAEKHNDPRYVISAVLLGTAAVASAIAYGALKKKR